MVLARLLPAVACGLGLLSSGALSAVQASFYACPAGCEAMLLPRDMEMIDDCLCEDGVDTTKEEEAANALDNGVFACQGRYKPKRGESPATSVADCDCYHPYEKDPSTHECILTSCPRAGNYEPEPGVSVVTSLADCTCTAPYTKVQTTGQCVLGDGGPNDNARGKYKCPPNSTPTPDVTPRSFDDCHCSWGFVRNNFDECEREYAAYVCPVNSVKRSDLTVGERPRGFSDCECLSDGNYKRDDEAHACWPVTQMKARKAKRKNRNVRGDTEPQELEYTEFDVVDRDTQVYECPPFSRAVATVPHSVEQCQCLPGYAWKLPEMICVRASAYRCPEHSYKRTKIRGSEIEVGFEDCACARGYFLDAVAQRCVPWMLANSNACPAYAVLTQWPLQSNANCKCVYGLNETIHHEEEEALRKAQDEEVANGGAVDQTPPMKRRKKECNTRPLDSTQTEFSQCPHDSIATKWPVATADDCTCLDGFEMTALSEEEISRGVGDGFRCLASPDKAVLAAEAAAACHAPQVIHPLSGECRLPVEELPVSKPSKKSKLDPAAKPEGVLFRGIEYDYELVDDNIMVIQGDVAIGERFVWEEKDPDDAADSETRIEHVLHGYYNSGRDHRWPHEQLYFQVDKSARPFLRTLLSAIEHITHATGFQFHRCGGDNCRTDMRSISHDFVVVQGVESSCYSFVGRIGGPQRLGVSADCGLGNVVHVLLHAIGLRHAVDRPDRDEHVRIAWECIPESKRSYFVVEDTTSVPAPTRAADRILDPPPYDLFSIMHHPVDAFVHSVPDDDDDKPHWCPSVIPLVADNDKRLAVMRRMGQREQMTTTDVKSVWALYPRLKKKHHDRQKASESGEAEAEDLHDSFVHTEEDAVATESATGHASQHRGFGQRLMSFLGAVVTLVGFGALLAFITTELRRRAMLSSDTDYFYEAPLIDSNNDI